MFGAEQYTRTTPAPALCHATDAHHLGCIRARGEAEVQQRAGFGWRVEKLDQGRGTGVGLAHSGRVFSERHGGMYGLPTSFACFFLRDALLLRDEAKCSRCVGG